MATREISGTTVEVNEEGYLTDHTQWNREIAEEIAKEENIETLAEPHWKVIEHLRKYYSENNDMPTIRTLKKSGIVPVKELYSLFPGGPLKKASRIAGLPKPTSCI
jgi:tRNA 2-thiouridine synthesizing protein E